MMGNKAKKISGIVLLVLVVVAVAIIFKIKSERLDQSAKPIEMETKTNAEVKTETVTKPFKINFLYGSNYWINETVPFLKQLQESPDAPFKTQTDFENAVFKNIDQISTYLKLNDWSDQYQRVGNTINIKLTLNNDGRTVAPRDYINYSMDAGVPTFNINFEKEDFYSIDVQLPNAITHIITFNNDKGRSSSFSKSLEYGLGEYVQNQLGPYQKVEDGSSVRGARAINQGVNVHKVLKYNEKSDSKFWNNNVDADKIYSMMGAYSDTAPYPLANIYGDFWILSSYSFVDYLIQTFGLEKVMIIYVSQDENAYKNIHPNGLNGLINDWKQYVNSFPEMELKELKIYNHIVPEP